jgi:hypothetical protein
MAIGDVGRLDREQFDPEVSDPVEQAVQLRLVPDVTDQHRLAGAVF